MGVNKKITDCHYVNFVYNIYMFRLDNIYSWQIFLHLNFTFLDGYKSIVSVRSLTLWIKIVTLKCQWPKKKLTVKMTSIEENIKEFGEITIYF